MISAIFLLSQQLLVIFLFLFTDCYAGPKRNNEGSASGGEYSQVIGSPVDSAHGSIGFDNVVVRGSNCNDDESMPVDSRNVSGSGDEGSYFDDEGCGDNQDDDTDVDDGDSDICTRDEELSVPGDDECQSTSDYDSRSLTPSSDDSLVEGRPIIPPLDLR